MVILKTSREIAKMRQAGRISQRALQAAGKAVEPGVSTYEIDCIVREYIEKQATTLGVVINGLLHREEQREKARIEICFADDIGQLFFLRHGILTVCGVDGRVY